MNAAASVYAPDRVSGTINKLQGSSDAENVTLISDDQIIQLCRDLIAYIKNRASGEHTYSPELELMIKRITDSNAKTRDASDIKF